MPSDVDITCIVNRNRVRRVVVITRTIVSCDPLRYTRCIVSYCRIIFPGTRTVTLSRDINIACGIDRDRQCYISVIEWSVISRHPLFSTQGIILHCCVIFPRTQTATWSSDVDIACVIDRDCRCRVICITGAVVPGHPFLSIADYWEN